MIDPIEAVVTWMRNDPTLWSLAHNGQIAGKHNYANTWGVGSASVVVRLDDGYPQIYLPLHAVRLEISCRAATQPEAMALWLQVVALSRATHRAVFNVAGGRAMLYYLLWSGGRSMIYDPDLEMDLCLGFMDALVAEDSVPVR